MENVTEPVEAIAEHAGVDRGKPASLLPRPTAHEHLRQVVRSPITVAAVVFALYGAWLMSLNGTGNHPYEMIWVGARFLHQSQASPTITAFGGTPCTDSDVLHGIDHCNTPIWAIGYDGQFFYYLALDPVNARYYMDVPTYRYTRIVYPLVARTVALGRLDLVPLTLMLVNWLAIAGGTLALAAWLRRKRLSPWFALVYALYPGMQVTLARDLSEALAYGLVVLAVYLFEFGPRYRLVLAAGVFALAALTRESTAIFGLAYAGAILFQGAAGNDWRARIRSNWQQALGFSILALAPLVLYKAFLLVWIGPTQDVGIPLASLPFQGIWHWRYWLAYGQIDQTEGVVIPGLICGVVATVALWRRGSRTALWLLLANVLLFIVFLQPDAYSEIEASSRVTTGVVLSAILSLAVIGDVPARQGWFWASSALWLSVMPVWLLFGTLAYFVKL